MRSIYGEENAHADIAASLNNLGNAWGNLRDHRKAISYYYQALEMMRGIFGEDNAHPNIAALLNNIGIAWNDLGDHRKAINYHGQSLQMRRSVYGEDTAHPDIIMSLNNLGNAWGNLSDHRKAVSYYDQALEMRRSIYGYRRVYHRGSMVGFTSMLSLYPSASGGVFTSMNGPNTAANDIHDVIHYQVADILTDKRDYEGVYGNHPTGNLTISLNTTDNKLYFSLGLIKHGLVLPSESDNQILLRAEEPLEYIPTIVADVEVKGGEIFSLSLQNYPPEPPILFERGLKLTDPDPTEPEWGDCTGVSGSPDRTASSNTFAFLLVLAYMFTV
uniref:Uncharacterized protein n=1 Tax=Branchiostoma floridae TaxID=7739 RepID=C3YN93_BRAFL|eukprot:XP_002602187.1 hypothetical protein BRAFLDRAFT_76875 [Branchiostoma floridae]